MRSVVAVLRGGNGREYDVSLKSGAAVLQALNQEQYEPRDIFISRDGQWHLFGVPVMPERALRGVDVAFNALRGRAGEGGEVLHLLEKLSIPYTGSCGSASAFAFNKQLTKQAVKKLGIRTPRALVVSVEDMDGSPERLASDIFRTTPLPAIVKPVFGGSSLGVGFADSYHALASALEHAFEQSPKVLVEEYIRGREASVGTLEDFRGEKIYTLLPVEIVPPPGSPFFDYTAKHGGGQGTVRYPGAFTGTEKEELGRLARTVHKGLGLSHYSRADFVISRRGIYFLEVNTAPALAGHTPFHHALGAVGATLSHFLNHAISLAQQRT